MRLDEILHQAGRHKRRTRVGRGTGSGHGKTAGRGTKGYYSRSGAVHRMNYEGGQTTTILRMPKRGFSNVQFARDFQIVNVSDLEAFPEGSRVDAEALAKAGLIERADRPVKVLGDGELKRKLTVAADRFSVSAIKKIMDASGQATTPTGQAVLPPPPPPPPAEKKPAEKKPKEKKPAEDKAEAEGKPEKAKGADKAKGGGRPKEGGKSVKPEKPEAGQKADDAGPAAQKAPQ